MVSEITKDLAETLSEHPEKRRLVLHVGAVDSRKMGSQEVQRDFMELFDSLGKLKIETFISGPLPTVGRGSYEFSRLLGLNTWLSGACKLKGLTFIDHWNIFWRQRDLFKRDGLHLNRSGEYHLTNNILFTIGNPPPSLERPTAQDSAQSTKWTTLDNLQASPPPCTSSQLAERRTDDLSVSPRPSQLAAMRSTVARAKQIISQLNEDAAIYSARTELTLIHGLLLPLPPFHAIPAILS